MAKSLPDYFKLKQYNISQNDIIQLTLGTDIKAIRPNVILNPCWYPDVFSSHVNNLIKISDKVYELDYNGTPITYIISGIGAPLTGDVVLSLAGTACEQLIFIGSVGGLLPEMIIGDLVLPSESIGGDGFSCYLSREAVKSKILCCPERPDTGFYDLIEKISKRLCFEQKAILHKGLVYSTDSIIAQFHHLPSIVTDYRCIAIEMETSAVFSVANLLGIKAAALLQLSDVISINKSLYSGRTKEDGLRRQRLKRNLLAKVALEAICD